jgi:REP element-mobilizing transposase RayT
MIDILPNNPTRESSSPKPLIFVTTPHRRRLPHFHSVGQPIFITWRLHGSLPSNRSFPSTEPSSRTFLATARILDDARTGPRYLDMPAIAEVVIAALRYQGDHLRHLQLHSFVVMPNHVHLLVTPLVEVSKVTHSLKRFTASECNRILRLTGNPFWQDESYDRLVRNQTEFRQISRHIEMNPAKAGLATTPEEFPYSYVGQDAILQRVANPLAQPKQAEAD